MNRGKQTGSLQDFRMAYYANSSRKAKASIRKTVNKILNNLGVKGTNECWSVEVLEQLGAVLRSSEYKAGVTYLAEYKNMLIEKGNVWTHQLQRAFAQPLASEKLPFFSLLQKVVCQPVFLASRFFMLEASGSQKKRLLEIQKRGF